MSVNPTALLNLPQPCHRICPTRILLLLLLALPVAVQAQFTYVTNNGTIAITGYTGAGSAVTIPTTINGLPVVIIGHSAFENWNTLASVTIPNTVTNIADQAFSSCTNLARIYFQGNPPNLGPSVFAGDNEAIVYYLAGTTGWTSTFGGLPTLLWSAAIQSSGPGFGVGTNGFGFVITGTTNIPVLVQACTNLLNGNWSPVGTNILTDGSSYFCDPNWTNYQMQLYRVTSMGQSSFYSSNVVGYLNTSLVGGPPNGMFQMIANPLCTTNNTIGALIQGAPDATVLYKFSGGWNGHFEIATYYLGTWDHPEFTLNPGEGAVVCSLAPWTITFAGEVLQGSLTNSYPPGFSIRASEVPAAGTLSLLGLSGTQLSDGDVVYKFNPTNQFYDIYVWFFGVWHTEATVAVGESLWLETQTAGSWIQNFTVH